MVDHFQLLIEGLDKEIRINLNLNHKEKPKYSI